MSYLVVLMLVFTGGTSICGGIENTDTDCHTPVYRTVKSLDECQAEIKNWVAYMRDRFKGQKDPYPATFITGCVQTGSTTQT